jgi:hypothetical protein
VNGKSSKVHKNLNVSVTVTFTVTGTGPFPIDMLRHDCCYPVDADDSDTIESSFDSFADGKRIKRKITLVSHTHPTVERWNDFGWSVVDGDVF